MRKRINAKLSLLLGVVFLLGGIGCPSTAKADTVKISNEDYVVSYKDSVDIFLSNKKSIGSDIGTEVYLTYTVESVDRCEKGQQGVVATAKPKVPFPYSSGQMEYCQDKQLLQEGYTYFYKFAVTKDGFEYTIIRAKGEESSYLTMPYSTGAKTDAMEHFGLWLGGGAVTAKLTHVRCYDKDGNDLGVQLSRSTDASCARDVSYSKNTGLNHSYHVTVDNQVSVAISNLKAPTSDTVYMEYTVESSDTKIYQTGLIISQAPEANYPFNGTGYMIYGSVPNKDDGSLLMEGAQYIICMERKNDEFVANVQRTYKGEKEVFSFPTPVGEYNKELDYFSLWFGEGLDYPVTCVLKDFKCYDSNNNNLGVQCNKKIDAEHSGEIEDYAGCDAVYYCEEDKSFIALYEEHKMTYTKEGKSTNGTYYISDLKDKVLTLSYGEGKEVFDYLYKRFTSEDGRVYERMGTYKATFVTGSKDKIETQVLSAENGFVVMKPEDPKKDGSDFEGWTTKDGKDFDFNTIVTKSVTLYAKWSGEAEREMASMLTAKTVSDYSPYISIVAGILILAGGMTGCVLLIRKGGKKHEKTKE